jgi:hypothetical protein
MVLCSVNNQLSVINHLNFKKMEEIKKETTSAAQPVIDSKIPEGPVAEKWTNYKAHQKLVNPANKRHLDIIVVGTGLAGASAACFTW